MNREEYIAYIQSKEWFELRRARLELDIFTCFVCGLSPDDCCLQAHHLTYERVGNELMEDLVTLCVRCHAEIHNRPSYDWESLRAMKDEYDERTRMPDPDTRVIEQRRRAAEDFLKVAT